MKTHRTTLLALGTVLVPLMMLAACSRNTVSGPARENGRGFFAVDPSEFSRVDRMGMPAIATAVITSKDAYNQADPTDDASGAFVGEIVNSVDFLHGALDDDLIGLGLVPCATADCVNQVAPFVVPDVITIDTGQPAGFPNGRLLTDSVIDITLALVLLDLGTHPVTALVGVNPTENDKPFLDDFPYLRPPHRGSGLGPRRPN